MQQGEGGEGGGGGGPQYEKDWAYFYKTRSCDGTDWAYFYKTRSCDGTEGRTDK